MNTSNVYSEIRSIIARIFKCRILFSISLICALFLFMGAYTTADATTITMNQISRSVAVIAEAGLTNNSSTENNSQLGVWSKDVSAEAIYSDNQGWYAWASADATQTSNIELGMDGSLLVTDEGLARKGTVTNNLPNGFPVYSYSRSSLLVSFSIDGPATLDLDSYLFSTNNSPGLDGRLMKNGNVIPLLDFSNLTSYHQHMFPLLAGDYSLYYWVLPADREQIDPYQLTFVVNPDQGGNIPAPEPSALLLLGSGLLGLAGVRNWSKKPR
jgi:hypothetical protein